MNFITEPGKQGEPLQLLSSARRTSTCSPRSIASLVRAINFGMFAVIVVPLLRVAEVGQRLRRQLRLVDHHPDDHHQRLMFPLRHKSVVSMRKMQEIQPEVKAIQDRYAKLKATDPAKQKMNQELMALYRERGVNPASGCVPMLLTLPVLIAFYALLHDGDRAARRAVLRLDSRPVAPDPLLRHAGADGRHPGLADSGSRRRPASIRRSRR